MLYFLVIVIVILFGVILYLGYAFNRDKSLYQSKINTLESFIVKISDEQVIQNNKMELSESLRQQIKHVNEVLNKDIFELNYELFDALSKKKS